MPEADQPGSKVRNSTNRLTIHDRVPRRASEGLSQPRSEVERAAVEGQIAKNHDAVLGSPQGDVAGPVARSLENFKVTCGVAVPERPAHFVGGARKVVSYSDDKARKFRCHGEEGAGLHRGSITSATPEGNAALGAQRVTGALMVGMSGCEDMNPQGVTGELTEESPTCENCPGIDKHIADDIDVEIVER